MVAYYGKSVNGNGRSDFLTAFSEDDGHLRDIVGLWTLVRLLTYNLERHCNLISKPQKTRSKWLERFLRGFRSHQEWTGEICVRMYPWCKTLPNLIETVVCMANHKTLRSHDIIRLMELAEWWGHRIIRGLHYNDERPGWVRKFGEGIALTGIGAQAYSLAIFYSSRNRYSTTHKYQKAIHILNKATKLMRDALHELDIDPDDPNNPTPFGRSLVKFLQSIEKWLDIIISKGKPGSNMLARELQRAGQLCALRAIRLSEVLATNNWKIKKDHKSNQELTRLERILDKNIGKIEINSFQSRILYVSASVEMSDRYFKYVRFLPQMFRKRNQELNREMDKEWIAEILELIRKRDQRLNKKLVIKKNPIAKNAARQLVRRYEGSAESVQRLIRKKNQRLNRKFTIKTIPISESAAWHISRSYEVLSGSVQRLSSGLHINSAEYVILHDTRNAQDGISMLRTAERAMATIDDALIHMKELAEQAATGSYSQQQRNIMDNEFAQIEALEESLQLVKKKNILCANFYKKYPKAMFMKRTKHLRHNIEYVYWENLSLKGKQMICIEMYKIQASSSIGRATVSKTVGWGFNSSQVDEGVLGESYSKSPLGRHLSPNFSRKDCYSLPKNDLQNDIERFSQLTSTIKPTDLFLN